MTVIDAERQVQPYDFQRRDPVERSRLRLLQPILEVLAHRISGTLTSLLQMPVKAAVGALEQQRWDEYVNSLPETTFLTGATVVPTGGRVVLHLPLPFSLALVDMRLGGSGLGEVPERPLTELEQRLVTEVATGVLAGLPPSLAPALTIGLGATSSVSSGMYLPGASPSDMCLVVVLDVDFNEGATHAASLCLPLLVLLPLLDAVERLERDDPMEETGIAATMIRQRLLETSIDISVHWPEIKLSPEEFLSLVPGDVIRLHRTKSMPIVLSVGSIRFCDVLPTTQNKVVACIVAES